MKAETGIARPSGIPTLYISGTYHILCSLVTKVSDKFLVDPEHVILALMRLRDFLIERGVKEALIPVYDPNRGKWNPQELYAILNVIFAETEITVHLYKTFYMSIA